MSSITGLKHAILPQPIWARQSRSGPVLLPLTSVALQYLYIVNDEVGSLSLVDAPEEGDLYPELVVAPYLVLQLHPRRAEGKTGVKVHSRKSSGVKMACRTASYFKFMNTVQYVHFVISLPTIRDHFRILTLHTCMYNGIFVNTRFFYQSCFSWWSFKHARGTFHCVPS